MNEKKILILKSDRDDFERYYIEHMQGDSINTYPIYKYNAGLMWKIIWLWREILRLPFAEIWYGKWKNEIAKYDIVIAFDNNLNWNILQYIKKKNPQARIIAWYWNTITRKKQVIPKKYRSMCEVWSFDKADCQKYGMKHNIQFYVGDSNSENDNLKYFAMFVGKDKGRYEIVTRIQKVFEENEMSTFINIVPDKTKFLRMLNPVFRQGRKKYKNVLSYQQVIKKIKESQCIIDIPQKGQEGMTLRVLEAFYYHKKLISTDESLKEKDWFCEDNIFILNDTTSKQDILKFLVIPYNRENEINYEEYSFDKWIKNFDIT